MKWVALGLMTALMMFWLQACTNASQRSDTEEPPVLANSSQGKPMEPPEEMPEEKPVPEEEEAKEEPQEKEDNIPVERVKVVNTYPHDAQAFTQGLQWHNGFLYEGTGLEGHSTIRKVELKTGKVLKSKRLAEQYFGEGITIWKDKIYQLTWRSGVCFVYNLETFDKIREHKYATEGWGLTHDGKLLIMSDGSSTLYFRDPETFQEMKRLEVKAQGTPVSQLNELEYIKGEIYANIWQTDMIARIDAKTGKVVGWIDCSGLLSEQERWNAEVLNGIAYDEKNDRLFITGKLWPKLFEIKRVKS